MRTSKRYRSEMTVFLFAMALSLMVLAERASALEYGIQHEEEPVEMVPQNAQPALALRRSAGFEPINNKTKSHGAVCIYLGSSCAERAKGHLGRFRSCNAEIEDNECLDFPSAAALYTCEANGKVQLYETLGCFGKKRMPEDVSCVDVNLGTYFLLCCTNGDPGADADLCGQDRIRPAIS